MLHNLRVPCNWFIILFIQVEPSPPPPKVHRDNLAGASALVATFLEKLLERMKHCSELSNDRWKFLILALVDYMTCLKVASKTL